MKRLLLSNLAQQVHRLEMDSGCFSRSVNTACLFSEESSEDRQAVATLHDRLAPKVSSTSYSSLSASRRRPLNHNHDCCGVLLQRRQLLTQTGQNDRRKRKESPENHPKKHRSGLAPAVVGDSSGPECDRSTPPFHFKSPLGPLCACNCRAAARRCVLTPQGG